MVLFEIEELRKIAKMSSLCLSDQELEEFSKQITILLDYIEELKEAPVKSGIDNVRNINVLREDKTLICDSSTILEQAPKTENTYFVVPKVLD